MFRVNQSKEKEKYTKYFSNIKMHNSILYLKKDSLQKKTKIFCLFFTCFAKRNTYKTQIKYGKNIYCKCKEGSFPEETKRCNAFVICLGRGTFIKHKLNEIIVKIESV